MNEGISQEIQNAAQVADRFVKVEGAAGTGKTQVIVQRLCMLADAGVDLQQVGVFAATRTAASELRARVSAASAQLAQVRICTPYEYAVQILQSDDAKAITGRTPRVLEDFEQRILTEDLKVIGIKPRRLREMLKFFYKSYSELADETDGFLLSTEERLLSDQLHAHLQARGAILPEELTNIATKYLRSGSASVSNWHLAYVLADDWQDYSLATQTMLELLAQTQLFICGNVNQEVKTTEAYPYPEGLQAFATVHEDAACVRLKTNVRSSQGIAAVGNALIENEGMDAALTSVCDAEQGGVIAVQWTLPNAEFVHVADYVVSRVKGSNSPVHPQQVYIAVPNALWGRAFAKVLADKGVKSATMLTYHALTGDPRDEEKCRSLRLFTVLNLVSNPADVAAWRNWCGFGDYLTHSNHWCRLEEFAAEQNMRMPEALEHIAQTALNGEAPAFLGAEILAQRYLEGRRVIEGAQGKKGFSLLNHLAGAPDALPADFADLIEPVAGTETAQELFARARAHTELQFPNDDAVRIGLPSMIVGQQFDTVIFTGFVDGFFPPISIFGVELEQERKDEIMLQHRRALYTATQAARNTLILSCFSRDDAASAESLGMVVHRIRDIDGKRMASLSPSVFIEEMGDAAPGFDTNI